MSSYCYRWFYFSLLLFHFIQSGFSIPKKYDPTLNNTSGFLPSTGVYYQPPSTSSDSEPRALDNFKNDTTSEREQRFGLSGLGAAAYPGSASGISSGLYAPLKIDLGGVVLGTLIGLGAVLIFPKLAHILSHGYGHDYGGYARSVETQTTPFSLTELMTNFETALEKYNIDSSSCMQRLVCTTVQNSRSNMATGTASSVDQWVEILTTNPLFSNMLDGTAIKAAVDAGWGSDQNTCSNYYPKCTINKQKLVQMVSNVIPSS